MSYPGSGTLYIRHALTITRRVQSLLKPVHVPSTLPPPIAAALSPATIGGERAHCTCAEFRARGRAFVPVMLEVYSTVTVSNFNGRTGQLSFLDRLIKKKKKD